MKESGDNNTISQTTKVDLQTLKVKVYSEYFLTKTEEENLRMKGKEALEWLAKNSVMNINKKNVTCGRTPHNQSDGIPTPTPRQTP